MTVRAALQAIGALTLLYLLFWTFVSLGPLGWLVIGTLLAIGLVQAHHDRSRASREEGDATYCANCGAAVDFDAFDAVDEAGAEWEVRHCTECGAPVVRDAAPDSGTAPENCAACGAPNDPERTTCKHCDAEL